MSEKNTSEPTVIAPGPKVKDPKRVVAGKKLGSISRKAKEEKALRLSQQSDNYNSESNDKTLYLVVGLLVVGAASYLLFLNKGKVVRTFSGDKEESDPVPKQEPTLKKENFRRIINERANVRDTI